MLTGLCLAIGEEKVIRSACHETIKITYSEHVLRCRSPSPLPVLPAEQHFKPFYLAEVAPDSFPCEYCHTGGPMVQNVVRYTPECTWIHVRLA